MILKVNEKEQYNITLLSEKTYNLEGEIFTGLCFNIANYDLSVDDIDEIFGTIESLMVIRSSKTEEGTKDVSIDFSKYKKLYKVDRRVSDELDTIQIILRA